MYSRFPINMVSINITHERCWSNYIRNGNIKVLAHISRNNVVRALITSNSGTLRSLMELKQKTRIKDILNVKEYSGKIVVDLLFSYPDSMRSILDSYGVITLEPIISNGNEIWSFLAYDYQLNSIKKELINFGKINKIFIEEYNPNSDIKLDDIELKILEILLEAGYYNYPRKITIGEIANMLKISESTISYRIRTAEKKIIEKFIKNIEKMKIVESK